ncbi:unnamed protein product [Prorocentrum cordatum]|nr:unnamed protein product [Polarella glacialis]
MQDLEHQRAMAQKRIRAAARVASSAAGPDAEQCAADRATLEDDLAGIERRIAGLRQRMRDRRAFRRGAGAPVAARPQEPDEAAAPQKARFQPPWEARFMFSFPLPCTLPPPLKVDLDGDCRAGLSPWVMRLVSRCLSCVFVFHGTSGENCMRAQAVRPPSVDPPSHSAAQPCRRDMQCLRVEL